MGYDSFLGKIVKHKHKKKDITDLVLPSESNNPKNILSFYPSVIMDKQIKNNTDFLWNVDSFKIQSINFTTKQIVIDKNIELPLFYEIKNSVNLVTWQIHKKGLNSNDNNSLLQLTNIISRNTFEFVVTEFQVEATLQANFTANSNISFRNPFMYYYPLNVNMAINAESTYKTANSIATYYPLFLTKINNVYKLIVLTIKSTGYWFKTNLIESNDFITWTRLTAANEINLSSLHNLYTWWGNPQPSSLNGNLFLGNSNVTDIDGSFIIPVSFFKVVSPLYQRSGYIKLSPDLTPLSVSPSYFTSVDVPDTSSWGWGQTSMMKFKDKTYLAVEIIPVATDRRSIYLFEVNLPSMALTTVCKISPSEKGNKKWNDMSLQQPSLFVYDNQMFLTCRGYPGTPSNYSIPNTDQPNGLFYFDEVNKCFQEHYANPIVVNPKLIAWGSNYYDHGGYNVYYPENDKLLALISLSAGTNTYNLLPVKINLQNEKYVNQWLTFNK